MDPKERFSRRAPHYALGRPGYAEQLWDELAERIGLNRGWAVADIGAGTGILSNVFLERGNTVFAVEPNVAMRAVAEQRFGGNPRFISRHGSAEATGLPDKSVRLVTAGQAFHWFDRAAAQREFFRILEPGGFCALVWNVRRLDAPNAGQYEALVDRFSGRVGQDHRAFTDANSTKLANFFAPNPTLKGSLPNLQEYDYDRLVDLTLSGSHLPLPGEAGYEAMCKELQHFFEASALDGKLTLEFDTRYFCGQVARIEA